MKKKDWTIHNIFIFFVKKKQNNQSGFTLLEVMLSVALLAIIGIFSAPVFHNFQVRNDQDIAVESGVHILRQAQSYARSGSNNTDWSVHFSTSSITLFQGQQFLSRDTSWDEVALLPGSVTISGTSEISFLLSSGQVSTTGTIYFISTNGETRNIAVNKYGTIEY